MADPHPEPIYSPEVPVQPSGWLYLQLSSFCVRLAFQGSRHLCLDRACGPTLQCDA